MTPAPNFSSPDLARRAVWWTFAAVALAFAIGANGGRYSPSGMVWLTLAIAGAIWGVFSRGDEQQNARFDARTMLNGALVLGCVTFAALSLTPSDSSSPFWMFCGLFALGALVAALVFRLSRSILIRRGLFPVFLIFQLCVSVSALQQMRAQELRSPKMMLQVRNDVQIFAIVGASELLAGRNPYSIRMPNVMGADMPFYSPGTTGKDGRVSFGYPYLPLSLLWVLPGHMAGDFRFMHALALVGAAFFLAYARPSSTSQLAAALFLLFPSSLFVLAMSWIEPVTIFFLAATLFCFFRAPRWLFLSLGCLVASKQYTPFLLVLLPLLVPEKEKWRPLLWQSLAVAALVSLPMALWDVSGFHRSVIEIQFKQPFRADSLSYLVTYLRASGAQLSPIFGFTALLGGLFWGLKRAPRGASFWCGAGAVAYLGFFAFNKQAFANYYFWPFALLLAAVAIALPEDEK